MFGLNHIIFRLHNVYGERQNIGDRYRNVVGIFMNCILQGKPLPVFGDGEQTRAFSYIADIAPIIAESVDRIEAYNQVFNVGADQPYTVNELGRAVCTAMDAEFRPQYLPTRSEIKHAFSSHAKMTQYFGVRPQHTLAEGLGRMATWVKRQGPRTSQSFGALDIAKNLPPIWRDMCP